MKERIDPVQRRWLEMQGYVGYTDEQLARFGKATRIAPAICVAFAILGTVLGSATIIWSLMVIAIMGAVLPLHPFDYLYNIAVTRFFNTEPVPRHGIPRKFACALATAMLFITGLAFYQKAMTTGYILGVNFVLTAAVPAAIGFCIPSYIFRHLFKNSVQRKAA